MAGLPCWPGSLLRSFVLVVALTACGGGKDSSSASARGNDVAVTEPKETAAPAATAGSDAPAVDDPCGFLDPAAVAALIGQPVDIESSTELSKPDIESGVQCSFYGVDAEAGFMGALTLFRFDNDVTARQLFDSDVIEFGDGNCFDGTPGGYADIDVVGAARAVLLDCGYTTWSVAGPNFVVTSVWPRDQQSAPDTDQMASFVSDVHAALQS